MLSFALLCGEWIETVTSWERDDGGSGGGDEEKFRG